MVFRDTDKSTGRAAVLDAVLDCSSIPPTAVVTCGPRFSLEPVFTEMHLLKILLSSLRNLSCYASFGFDFAQGALLMEWVTPQHEEIDLNCEISSYANAEL